MHHVGLYLRRRSIPTAQVHTYGPGRHTGGTLVRSDTHRTSTHSPRRRPCPGGGGGQRSPRRGRRSQDRSARSAARACLDPGHSLSSGCVGLRVEPPGDLPRPPQARGAGDSLLNWRNLSSRFLFPTPFLQNIFAFFSKPVYSSSRGRASRRYCDGVVDALPAPFLPLVSVGFGKVRR